MLQFFRKYQRYFYVIITIVIVISFSFFGTYGTLSNGSFREQIAFTAINGSDVTRYELDEMVQFLATDSDDKLLFGGAWGPNFLNNGVIRKDFLETGLGVLVAEGYVNLIASDINARHDKEQRFALYTHPQAQFISVEGAWNYFNPNIKEYYNIVRNAQDPTSPIALRARMALYLMERQFPPALLKQVLRYQESQHSYVKPDPNLNYLDLSLFGHHTMEDWFGPRFTRLVAEFIINASIIAEERGYHVTRTEALADLKRNAEVSYQQNLKSPHLGVRDSHEYFQEQLRRLGMDQNMASKVWQKVMLFRRLYQDLGSAMFVDPTTYRGLNEFALESLSGTIYKLPKDMQINSYRTLQKFEAYLDAIAKRSDDDKLKLALPTTFLSSAEISKKNPALVEKKYLLNISEVSKKNLEATISLKETWAWETSAEGWKKLQTQFTDLNLNADASESQRFAALEALDGRTRERVDTFARSAIIDSHPELIANALKEAKPTQKLVGLTEAKGPTPFAGVTSAKKLMELLDAASIGTTLAPYTGDNNTYFAFTVVERAPQAEVLTFAQANRNGTLDKILDAQLEEYYGKIRDAFPADFQAADKSWKPFADVKDTVADKYFDRTLKGLRKAYADAIAPEKPQETLINDLAATYRLYPYVHNVQQQISKNPSLSATLAKEASEEPKPETMKESAPLNDQWKLEKSETNLTKSHGNIGNNKDQLFALKGGEFSAVNTPANGDINFILVKERGNQTSTLTQAATAMQSHRLLAEGAQLKLMQQLLQEMKAKKAISLEYLDQTAEAEPEEYEQLPENNFG